MASSLDRTVQFIMHMKGVKWMAPPMLKPSHIPGYSIRNEPQGGWTKEQITKGLKVATDDEGTWYIYMKTKSTFKCRREPHNG